MMGAKAPVYNIPNPNAGQSEELGLRPFFAIVLIAALLFAALIGFPLYYVSKQDAESEALVAAAPFHVGDIVQSRIAKFRGTVIGVSCNKGCGYEVRFNVFSMEPQWVEEYEIQPMKKKAEK